MTCSPSPRPSPTRSRGPGLWSCRAIFHYFRREPDAVRELIEAAMTLATEKGFSYWLTHGPILQGWLLSREGRPDEAILRIREGLAGFLAMGAKLTRTWQLGLLATTCGSLERTDEGLGVLDEAFALVEKNGERMYEAELHRLRGELLLRCSPDRQPEAESCFQRALTIARQQKARWWELRAATSLGRLWQAHGSAGARARDRRVGLLVVHGRLRHARPPGRPRPTHREHGLASASAALSTEEGTPYLL